MLLYENHHFWVLWDLKDSSTFAFEKVERVIAIFCVLGLMT